MGSTDMPTALHDGNVEREADCIGTTPSLALDLERAAVATSVGRQDAVALGRPFAGQVNRREFAREGCPIDEVECTS